ncbi:hypothetical protein SLA2020_330660 [Shorea laevis]
MLIIKNIPNKYTSKMLLAAIDEHCQGTYDFINLPIDFRNKCNMGYAFINMIDPEQIIPFHKAFNGKKLTNSILMNEDKQCCPILFHTDGLNTGDDEPFPMGTNIQSKPGKPQTTSPEKNCQCSSSTSAKGEEPSNGVDSWSGYLKYFD